MNERQNVVLLNRRIAELERERDEARKLFDAAVQLVHDAGLATGHADDAPSLMSEVLEQVEQIRGQRDEARREAEWWRAGIHGESTPEFAFFPWETEAQPGD